jgi:hypothetical protein
MITVQLDQTFSTGLGAAISTMSLMLHPEKLVTASVPYDRSIYYELVNTFDIKHLALTKDVFDTSIDLRMTYDCAKIASPYFNVDVINFENRTYPVNKGQGNKKFIVVPWSNHVDPTLLDNNLNSSLTKFPYNRYYNSTYLISILKLIYSAGFDILTLNFHTMSLSEIAYLLNRHCACVIGYEGGIQHLAHLLGIPTIVLPWHNGYAGNSFDTHAKQRIYLLHLDKRTYIVDNIDEIVGWSAENLTDMIQRLYSNGGNNKFIGAPMYSDLTDIIIDSSPNLLNVTGALQKHELNFISDHLTKPLHCGGFIS